jgi:LuxR family maltose regulon positive regulatory protein
MTTAATTGPSAAAAAAGVLRTRLLPPRMPPRSVPRPELVERVHRGLEGRLTALVAGAGYGKTTLLVQALETSPMRAVWLSCDPRLRTPEMLVAHVAAGVADAFPGVASALPQGGPPERAIAALANELVETIPDDFVLALDDVHALGGDAMLDALGLLASDLPPNVHLAMTSRRELAISTSKVAVGGATTVGEDLLAFSFQEATELLEDAPGGLGEAEIGELHQRTEGWVAGLLLATRSGVGSGLPQQVATVGPHFDYLADEVLAGLPADLQRFLLETAVLERFTPALAAAVADRPDAPDVIRDLVASHLFIVQAQGDWFRYHHLFHAFLRRRLVEREPDRLAVLHERAARAWEAAGEHQEAVRHYLEAGAPDEAAAALEQVAESMVPTPERQTLAGWLERIPQEAWRPRPRIALAHALLTYLAGDAAAAFEGWDEAIGRLIAAGEVDRAAAALYRAQLAMLTVGVSPALRIATAERHLGGLAAAGPAAGLVRMIVAVAHAIGCRRAEAEALIDQALASAGRRELALLAPCAEMVRGFYFDYPEGRLAQAAARLDDGLARIEPIEVEESFMMQAFGRGNRALMLADTGRYNACLEAAEGVLEVSASLGMAAAPGLLILWWRLLSYAGLGDWDAVSALEPEARRAMAAGAGTNVAYRLGAQIARGAAARGEADVAVARVEAARAAARAYGDSYEMPAVLGELSLAASAAGAAPLARELAEEALALADRYGFDWYRARAALLSASAHGETPLGDERLAEAVDLTARLGLEALWIRRERPRAAALLARALEADLPGAPAAATIAAACGREVLHGVAEMAGRPEARAALADAIGEETDVDPETLRLLLADGDPAVTEAAERARGLLERRPRPAIRLEAFGGLRLYRAGARVPDSAFGRAKARALLGALACAGPRGVHRERLLDHLWPELPVDRGSRALDTTLHELRRTLDPLAAPRSGGSPIVREGDVYRLELGERDSWDAGDFARLAAPEDGTAADEGALERMLAAETLWRGEFLPDFPYEPWCEDTRRDLERQRVELLERLAGALLELGRPAAAIERYRQLVDADPEREGWHRALMRAYAQAGERALALRQFHACRAILRGRLGIEPSQETRELYASLL